MVHVCVLQESRPTLLFILNASLVVTDETIVRLIPNMLFLFDGVEMERSNKCHRSIFQTLCFIIACKNVKTREKA